MGNCGYVNLKQDRLVEFLCKKRILDDYSNASDSEGILYKLCLVYVSFMPIMRLIMQSFRKTGVDKQNILDTH